MHEFTLFFLRWMHFLAGVTWIGILYYFNFVQTPFFAETEAPVRIGAIQKLLPRALWWFRWGAMITFLAGILIYIMRLGEMGGSLFYSSPYGVTITVGGLMGILMFLNVWLVIWPNQQIVMASTNQVASGGQALAGGSRSRPPRWPNLQDQHGLFNSHAVLTWARRVTMVRWCMAIRIPRILLVFGDRHFGGRRSVTPWSALKVQPRNRLDSVNGALWCGFLLTGILFLLTLGA